MRWSRLSGCHRQKRCGFSIMRNPVEPSHHQTVHSHQSLQFFSNRYHSGPKPSNSPLVMKKKGGDMRRDGRHGWGEILDGIVFGVRLVPLVSPNPPSPSFFLPYCTIPNCSTNSTVSFAISHSFGFTCGKYPPTWSMKAFFMA